MRESIFAIIFGVSICLSTFAANSEWVIKSDNGLTTLYSLKSDPRVRGSVRKSNRVVRVKEFKDQKFREKIVSKRKGMLSMLGATNWKLKKQIWEDEKVMMMGTYQDRDGESVSFLEVHHYKTDSTLQALLTATGRPLDEKSKVVTEFFNLHKLVVKW